MTIHVDLTKGITKQATDNLIDELMYRSYRRNRLSSPHIAPEKYDIVYSNRAAMEARFMVENN